MPAGSVHFLPDIVILVAANHQDPHLRIKLLYFFE